MQRSYFVQSLFVWVKSPALSLYIPLHLLSNRLTWVCFRSYLFTGKNIFSNLDQKHRELYKTKVYLFKNTVFEYNAETRVTHSMGKNTFNCLLGHSVLDQVKDFYNAIQCCHLYSPTSNGINLPSMSQEPQCRVILCLEGLESEFTVGF